VHRLHPSESSRSFLRPFYSRFRSISFQLALLILPALAAGTWMTVRIGAQSQLTAHYKLDEAAGITANDSSGNGKHGTLIGNPSPTWTTGKLAGAVNLSGNGQSMDTGSSLLNTAGDYSVSAWVLLYQTGNWFTAVSQDGATVSSFYLQHTSPSSGVGSRFAFTSHSSDSTNNPGNWALSSFSPSVGTWYHLVGVHDSVNDQLKLYVNGVFQETKPFANGWNAPGNTVVGRAKWNGGLVDYWPGKIDDVRVYSRVLNPEEIQDLHKANSGRLVKEYVYSGNRLLVTEEAGVIQSLPNAPTNLQAVAVSSSQLNLSWDNVTSEDGYKIEQSTDGVNFTQIATRPADTTSYGVVSLQSSTSYHFRVLAYNSSGNSPYSNVSSATTSAPPGGGGDGLKGEYFDNADLTALSVTRIDPSVNFNWGASSPKPSVLDVDYFSARWTGRVEPRYSETYTFYTLSDNGVRLWVNGELLIDRWSVIIGENSGTISLTASQKYDLRLEFMEHADSASISFSWSSASQTKEVVPQSQLYSGTDSNTLPSAPVDLKATVISSSQVKLTWADLAINESGFKIEQSSDGSNFTEIGTVASDTSTFSISGLSGLTTYTFRVRAYNALGDSGYATITVTPAATGTGLKGEYYNSLNLTNLVLTRIDPALNFDWGWGTPDPTVPADNFSVRWTGQVQPRYSETYTFYTDTDEGLRFWVNGQLLIDRWSQIGGAQNSGTISLTAGQKYDFRMEYWEGGIVSRAKLFWSSTNQSYEVIPQSQLYPGENSLLPEAPLNLRAKTISANQIDLAWQDNANNESGYKIQRSTDGGVNFEEIATLASNATYYSANGLLGSTVYVFRVYAHNEHGNSAYLSATAATNGNGVGLKGEYFDNKDLTNLKLTRTDPVVSFDWGWGSPDPSVDGETFSARWTGQVQPRYTETYTFYTYTGDGVRLWVNGQLLVDQWIYQEAEHSNTIALIAGQKYDIRMEYYEDSIFARAYLSWASASQTKEIIPQSQLYFAGGGTGCLPGMVPPPASLPPDTIWFDDTFPAGAVPYGTWGWDSEQKVSGTVSHRGLSYPGLYHFENATETLSVSSSENLVTYVLINPCKPPKEIVLHWRDSSGSWEHRAFWGQDLIGWGTLGTASRYSMGPLPEAGQWVRLEVPAAFVGMGGRTANGMAFTLYDGEAWFDRAGKAPGTCVTAPPPASVPSDVVWIEDQLPAGAVPQGTWVWDTTQKVSGTQSNTEPSAAGLHQHYFENASQTLTVNALDKLFTYVLLNPCDPPSEIMLQWRDSTGSWEHRAIWGADLISAGTIGTPSRYPMGLLPQSNAWVRLEVPASAVGLEGATINGMAFTLFGGQAWFDRAGVVRAAGVVPAAAAFIQTDATTQGNWKGVYGTNGQAIANDSTNYPSYAEVAMVNELSYTWAGSTTDVRALQKAATTDRIASTWYSGSSFDIYVNLTDGNWHEVAFYCLDWDGNNSRAQTVEVLDADTGAVLDSRSLSAFSNGRYLIWNLKGHVKLRVTKTAGGNGVVSGVFFN